MKITIQVRVDAAIKKKAQQIFESHGLKMSSGISMYLYKVAEEGFPFALIQSHPSDHCSLIPEKEAKEKNGYSEEKVEHCCCDSF